jgi:hypothetical protein
MRRTALVCTLTILSILSVISGGSAAPADPCKNMQPAVAGGPVAKSDSLLTWRWLGNAT